MPHIILFDEFGNEIGREEHDPGTGGSGLFAPMPEDDHDATRVIVNLARVAELMKQKEKPKKK